MAEVTKQELLGLLSTTKRDSEGGILYAGPELGGWLEVLADRITDNFNLDWKD